MCDQRVHPRCSEMAPDASLQPCGGLHDKCRGSSQLKYHWLSWSLAMDYTLY